MSEDKEVFLVSLRCSVPWNQGRIGKEHTIFWPYIGSPPSGISGVHALSTGQKACI